MDITKDKVGAFWKVLLVVTRRMCHDSGLPDPGTMIITPVVMDEVEDITIADLWRVMDMFLVVPGIRVSIMHGKKR